MAFKAQDILDQCLELREDGNRCAHSENRVETVLSSIFAIIKLDQTEEKRLDSEDREVKKMRETRKRARDYGRMRQ